MEETLAFLCGTGKYKEVGKYSLKIPYPFILHHFDVFFKICIKNNCRHEINEKDIGNCI